MDGKWGQEMRDGLKYIALRFRHLEHICTYVSKSFCPGRSETGGEGASGGRGNQLLFNTCLANFSSRCGPIAW